MSCPPKWVHTRRGDNPFCLSLRFTFPIFRICYKNFRLQYFLDLLVSFC